jgi:uncharacterized protein (UPF0248 family)
MKKLFIFAVVAAAAMIGFSACEPFNLPEIIDSKVVGSGVGSVTVNTTTSENGASVLELSYKSFIRIMGHSDVEFDDTVAVDLNGVFCGSDTTMKVENLDVGGYTTDISYRVRDTREDGYVTIIDSVLVYTVNYGSFSLVYELDYEVPIYNDGVTREVMPYHRIVNIVDKEDKSYRIESTDDGDLVYARKQIEHTIEVTFGAETYEVKAVATIWKDIASASEPYIKSSEVIVSHASVSSNHVVSSLSIKRVWSTGQVENKDMTVTLKASVGGPVTVYKTITGYKNDFKVDTAYLTEREVETDVSNQYEYVYYEHIRQYWNVEYNYPVSVLFYLVHDEAYYDDGYTRCKFPNYEFGNITTSEPQLMDMGSGDNENGHYQDFWVNQTVTAKFGDINLEGTLGFSVRAYD